MTNRIQSSEWEALSAYLDNQLPPKDRTHLEARLKREVDLRQALDELRRTRAVLRSQRPVRAPRNFTLTPAMAGVRRSRARSLGSPFGVLRLASVLATIFFILLTAGDLAVQQFGPPPREVSMADQPVLQGPAMGMGGGGGGGAVVPVPGPGIEAATVESQAAPEAGVAPETGLAASVEAPDAHALVVTPVSTPADSAGVLREGDAPPAAEPPMGKQGQPPAETTTVPPARPPAATLVIRLLQGMLLLLAVGAGLAAFYMRRTS